MLAEGAPLDLSQTIAAMTLFSKWFAFTHIKSRSLRVLIAARFQAYQIL